MGLSVVELSMIADNAGQKSKSVKLYAEKLITLCSKIEDISTALSRELLYCSSLSDPIGESEINTLSLLEEQLRACVYCAYKEIVDPIIALSTRSAGNVKIADFLKYNDSTEQIITVVEAEKIYIRVPILWAKGRYKNWTKKHGYLYDYLGWFCENLNSALTALGDNIPKYRKKNITYLFVRDLEGRSTIAIPDSDNYDTKSITDVITSNLAGGDSAISCSFAYMSAVTNDIAEGTYIVISEGLDISASKEGIISDFKQLLSR